MITLICRCGHIRHGGGGVSRVRSDAAENSATKGHGCGQTFGQVGHSMRIATYNPAWAGKVTDDVVWAKLAAPLACSRSPSE